MKKLFAMLSIVCAFALMVSCSSSSPSSVVEKQMNAMKSGNYEKMLDFVYFKGSAEDVAETKEQYLSMLKQLTESRPESDALASFKIGKETISESGDKATVEVTTVSKGGQENSTESKAILVDGKWYVDSGK